MGKDKNERITLTERDERIMQFIYDYGGVIHKARIQEREFPSSDSMRKRLDELIRQEYLARPEEIQDTKGNVITDQIKEHPQAQGCYWLGWRGAIWIAQDKGKAIEMPQTCTHDQRRQLAKKLADLGIVWRDEPNWTRVPHDCEIAEVHIAITKATATLPHLKIEEWIHENSFRTQPEKFSNYPDAYFAITDSLAHPNQAARFLLEIDRTNHKLEKLIEKFRDGLALLQSQHFRKLSGANAGRYLVVLDSKERITHLIPKIREAFGEQSYIFLLAAFDDATKANPLFDPIWLPGHANTRQTMLEERRIF